MHLFPTRNFKRFCRAMITITGLWAIAAFFSTLLQCQPIALFWDKSIKGGHCLDLIPIGVANASLSLVGDVVILAMPIPMIWGLQLNIRKKIAVSGIFLLGGLYVSNFISSSCLFLSLCTMYCTDSSAVTASVSSL